MAKEEMNKEDKKEMDYEDWGEWKKPWHDKDWRKKYWMKRHHHRHHGQAGGQAVYFLGFIGALVYFWQHADTFWNVVMGFIQSIVWPAILVWHLFNFFKL